MNEVLKPKILKPKNKRLLPYYFLYYFKRLKYENNDTKIYFNDVKDILSEIDIEQIVILLSYKSSKTQKNALTNLLTHFPHVIPKNDIYNKLIKQNGYWDYEGDYKKEIKTLMESIIKGSII